MLFNLSANVKPVPAFSGIVVIALFYGLNRIVANERIVTYTALGIGLVMILIVATNATPPYIEYSFLIYLPLLSSILLSPRETVLISSVTFACLLVFGGVRNDLPELLFRDLVVFNGVSQAFIIFVAIQRNRLEIDRQQLAVASSRGELMNELITNLSHDFRTPLSIINTSAYLLVQPADANKRQMRADQIMAQTTRLDAILEDILFISRLGQIETQSLTAVDLNALVTAAAAEAEAKAQTGQVQITLKLQPDLPLITGRSDHLRRALGNIVDNALQHTPLGGSITMQTGHSQQSVTVAIRDTGAGITPEDLPRIFEPFFRGDKSRALDTGGAGLGLSIAKRIIEVYGGNIRVESQVGGGSVFYIAFPAARLPRRRPRL